MNGPRLRAISEKLGLIADNQKQVTFNDYKIQGENEVKEESHNHMRSLSEETVITE